MQVILEPLYLCVSQYTISALRSAAVNNLSIKSRDDNKFQDYMNKRIANDLLGIQSIENPTGFGNYKQILLRVLFFVLLISIFVLMTLSISPLSLRLLVGGLLTYGTLNMCYHILIYFTRKPVNWFENIIRNDKFSSSITGYLIYTFITRFSFVVKNNLVINNSKEDDPSFVKSFSDLLLTVILTAPTIFLCIWILIQIGKQLYSFVPAHYLPQWIKLPVNTFLGYNIGYAFFLTTIFLLKYKGWIKRTDKCYELLLNISFLYIGISYFLLDKQTWEIFLKNTMLSVMVATAIIHVLYYKYGRDNL